MSDDIEDIDDPQRCMATGCYSEALYCSAPCAISDAMSRDEALEVARQLVQKFGFTSSDFFAP